MELDGIAGYLQKAATACWSGVDLFFVLSGFLIGGVILDNHKRSGFLKVFWIRRFCRIVPVLAVLLTACIFLRGFLDVNKFHWIFSNLMPMWSYATFTQNILMSLAGDFGGHFLGITWSLSVEEQFYLLAPLLILLVGRRVWLKALLPLIVTAVLLRLIFPGFHMYILTPFRMDALLSGVLVAGIVRNPASFKLLMNQRAPLFVGFILVVLATGALILRDGFGNFKLLWFVVLYSWFLTVVILYKDTAWTYILRMPLLCFWGTISYGLYMYHQAISGLMHGYFRNGAEPSLLTERGIVLTGITFLVSSLTATISFYVYELPIQRIGKRYKYGQGVSIKKEVGLN